MEAVAAGAGSEESRRIIVFTGFMGAGKTSAARALAAELGVEPIDVDRELERELGEPIEGFFDREGEAVFRAREEQMVLRLLARPDARVIALGGGSLASERVREALREHLVVHLDVDPDAAWHRSSGKGRPLARDQERFRSLYEERRAQYDAAADILVPPGERGMAVRAVARGWTLPSGARMIWARAGRSEHPVYFGRGLLGSDVVDHPHARRFVVTDENVRAAHRVEGDWEHVLPPGEEQKTLARAEEVLRAMAQSGVTRGDVVVAVGGGVLGDLAGFCAAVYQRGVRCVQVPTTLVAQVDSAYGGKTGVDLPEAKNYVGAYHQPAAVVTDPGALETLPREELAAGYAEVVKTALIAGGELWARVRRGGEVDDETILGCLRTKLAIVAEDERDTSRRQVLNLGHTVAHAIEAATGYRRYRHGEAVAIGLLCELRLSGQDRLRDEVAGLLAAHGLPLQFEGVDPMSVFDFIARDKKRVGIGSTPFVLVEAPGRVTPGHLLEASGVRAALQEAYAG